MYDSRSTGASGIPRDTRWRRPLLRALAATCLAAAMVSAPAMVAGGIAAGAPAATLAGSSPLLAATTAAPVYCLAAVAGNSQASLSWFPPAPANEFAVYDAATPDGQPVE